MLKTLTLRTAVPSLRSLVRGAALAAFMLASTPIAAQPAPDVDAMIATTLDGARAGHVGCIRKQIAVAVKKRVGDAEISTYQMPGLAERIALADEVIAGCAAGRAVFLADLEAAGEKQRPFGDPTRAVIERVRAELDTVETEFRDNLRDAKPQDSNAPNN